jgi:hypothetical protein
MTPSYKVSKFSFRAFEKTPSGMKRKKEESRRKSPTDTLSEILESYFNEEPVKTYECDSFERWQKNRQGKPTSYLRDKQTGEFLVVLDDFASVAGFENSTKMISNDLILDRMNAYKEATGISLIRSFVDAEGRTQYGIKILNAKQFKVYLQATSSLNTEKP